MKKILWLLFGAVMLGTGGRHLVIDAAAEASMDPIQTLPEGKVQVHYSKQSSCETVLFLCVGTAMTVDQYQDLGSLLVQHSIGTNDDRGSTTKAMVVIFIDNNPGGMRKQNGKEYTDLVNAVYRNFTALVPTCPALPKQYLIGGHSAGGQGGVEALRMKQLAFVPAGFVGLSPYKISSNLSIDIPSLNIGFSKMSCAVTPKQAALAAYLQTKDTDHRVFYQVQTNTRTGSTHCSFADAGCFHMCKGNGNFSTWMHDFVGRAVHLFESALQAGTPFCKEHFEQQATTHAVSLFVNQDDPQSRRMSKWWLFEAATWPHQQWLSNGLTAYWKPLVWK